MILHVLQWVAMGSTLGPMEPSESMETVKHGIVTVGFIVFALAILSTAILGRWFCGWGCHVILLQDWCGQLLHSAGIKPRAFHSRLLRYLPLVLALYMFVWPVVYRLAVAPFVQPDLAWDGFSWRLTTVDFWATFPGWLTAIPFLLVCGFLTVYFLGQKGYCTYACPYAGFFVPVETLAVGRIRVNEDCEGCGHCTAVCTSNVRVHEEVATYGMVVDPGCMKCMDCVSVCPKNALSFGFGSAAAGRARKERAPRRWDLSLREELLVAAAAVFAFYSVYFPFGQSAAKFSLPLLFASGISVCAAFMAWKSSLILQRRPTGFHRWNLVRDSRIQRPGLVWLAATLLAYSALADNLALNAVGWSAFQHDLKVQVSDSAVFGGEREKITPEIEAEARAALSLYEIARPVGMGGWSLFPDRGEAIALRCAWLSAVLGEYPQAESLLRAAFLEEPREPIAIMLARTMRAQGHRDESDEFMRAMVADHRAWGALEDERRNWLLSEGRVAEAVQFARDLASFAGAASVERRRLATLLIEVGDTSQVEEGVSIARAIIASDGGNPFAHAAIATGLLRLQRPAEAVEPLRRAIELDPSFPQFQEMIAEALEQSGEPALAALARERAAELGAQRGTQPRSPSHERE